VRLWLTNIFLATKVSRNDFPNIRKSLESSLERLNRSSVDLLKLHGSSFDDEHIDTILKAAPTDQLDELKREGLIRNAGFTTEANNEAVYTLIRSSRFEVMQICYNFIYQHPYEPSRPFGSIIEAHNRGMGIVTMRAMTSGILQRWIQHVSPDNTYDYTPALLQFVLSNLLVNVELAGIRTVDEVEQNAAIASDLDNRVSMDWLHERYIKRSDA
jgi:predicted aldo/keto reductase-like oxidoreductase